MLDLTAPPAYYAGVSHFILLTYIVLLSSGGAGVAALAMLHHRFRRPFTRYLLIVNVMLLASLFLNIISFYFESIIHFPVIALAFRYFLGYIFGISVYVGVALALLQLPETPRRALKAATAFTVLIMTARLALVLQGTEALQAKLRFPSTALISLYLLFLAYVLIRHGKLIKEETIRWLSVRLGWFTAGFSVLSTIFYRLIRLVPFAASINISLDFIFYLIWSIISVAAFLRYLARPTVIEEERSLSDSFIHAYAITPREAEVIVLISTGKSNKEIADLMCVSFATARTHVYNIFQKTGVKSRVELLRLVSGFRE